MTAVGFRHRGRAQTVQPHPWRGELQALPQFTATQFPRTKRGYSKRRGL